MKRVLTAAITLVLFTASYTNTNYSELFNKPQNKDVMEKIEKKYFNIQKINFFP